MHLQLSLGAALVGMVLAGCGGDVVVEGSGAGASSATGGSGGGLSTGGSTSSGTTSTTGTTNTCAASGECGNGNSGCVACSVDGPCAQAYAACFGSDDCTAFLDCTSGCGTNPACLLQCSSDHELGAQQFEALASCTYCDVCATVCKTPTWLKCAP